MSKLTATTKMSVQNCSCVNKHQRDESNRSIRGTLCISGKLCMPLLNFDLTGIFIFPFCHISIKLYELFSWHLASQKKTFKTPGSLQKAYILQLRLVLSVACFEVISHIIMGRHSWLIIDPTSLTM